MSTSVVVGTLFLDIHGLSLSRIKLNVYFSMFLLITKSNNNICNTVPGKEGIDRKHGTRALKN